MSNLKSKRQDQFHLCHFSFTLDFSKGGVPYGLALIASELTRHGVMNQIISLGNTQEQINRNARGIENIRKSGVGVALLKARFKNDYGIGKLRPIKISLETMPLPNFVVLHQVYTLSTLLGYRYAKRNGIAYAVFPHGSLTKYNELKSPLIKFFAKKLILSRILRKANAIIVTCESEKNDLPTHLQRKAVLIPYGAETKEKHFERNMLENPPSIEKRILFSGRFVEGKNLRLLIEALREIVKIYPNLILDIAGSGTEKETQGLQRLIQAFNLEKNVKFHGWVDKAEMEKLLEVASLLVLPSENENFALVVSEALSSGVPCVVSQFVGIADIVEKHHAGEIIEVLTPESVATAVIKVLKGNADAYRDAAFKAAREDLDWPKIALRWKDLISSFTIE